MIRTRITNPHFETWVVTQADSSPIRLRFETWVVTQADSYPNHNPRFETWVVTQADSSPIRLRFETWVVTQADSPQIEIWNKFQVPIPKPSQIYLRDPVKSQAQRR